MPSPSIQNDNIAGLFYPKDPKILGDYISHKIRPSYFPNSPKMLIMPHAGYRYSGNIQALLAREINPKAHNIIIISPSHHIAFQGAAMSSKAYFETPLGEVQVNKNYQDPLKNLAFVKTLDNAFENEHGIFTILPWIKFKNPSAQITPLVIGELKDEDVDSVLKQIWGDEKTQIIISTDLSHFFPKNQQMALDLATAKNVETHNYNDIERTQACGWRGLRAAVKAAKNRGMRFTRLAMSDSSATSKNEKSVVGYGAWVGHLEEDAEFATAEREHLYNLAAKSIFFGVNNNRPARLAPFSSGHILETYLASFITLNLNGKLRGCIGSMRAHAPIADDVFYNAYKSAFKDARFEPISMSEFNEIECEISILSQPKSVKFAARDELVNHLIKNPSGLTIRYQNHRATFLPKVWTQLPDAQIFLEKLMQKAKLPANFWHDDIEIEVYNAEVFPSINLKSSLQIQKT